MGDRTNFQLQVVSCPPEQARAVLNWIDYLGLSEDWGYTPRTGPDVLKLGVAYCANEVPCGSTGETVSTLSALSGVAFSCWEDPYADWLGEMAHHVPSLSTPTWRMDCDANGEPMWNASGVLRLLGLDSNARAWAMGDRHADAIGGLAALSPGWAIVPKDDPDEYELVEHDYVCAECGTRTAHIYVVTVLDPKDPSGTRTEVCHGCSLALEKIDRA